MGNVVKKEVVKEFHSQVEVVESALRHFSKAKEIGMIDAVARYALSDQILFESFDLWNKEEIDDDDLLFQIKHFYETKDHPVLSPEKRNLTGNSTALENIKKDTDALFSKKFANKLTILASSHKLDTNEKLGKFLGVSKEQARQLLQGEHKPQRKTLMKVAEAFRISVEDFLIE